MFTRVKDPDIGHEFDLPEDHFLIRQGRVTPVKGVKTSPVRRPPAFSKPKSPAEPQPVQSASSHEAPDATEKEKA